MSFDAAFSLLGPTSVAIYFTKNDEHTRLEVKRESIRSNKCLVSLLLLDHSFHSSSIYREKCCAEGD